MEQTVKDSSFSLSPFLRRVSISFFPESKFSLRLENLRALSLSTGGRKGSLLHSFLSLSLTKTLAELLTGSDLRSEGGQAFLGGLFSYELNRPVLPVHFSRLAFLPPVSLFLPSPRGTGLPFPFSFTGESFSPPSRVSLSLSRQMSHA